MTLDKIKLLIEVLSLDESLDTIMKTLIDNCPYNDVLLDVDVNYSGTEYVVTLVSHDEKVLKDEVLIYDTMTGGVQVTKVDNVAKIDNHKLSELFA